MLQHLILLTAPLFLLVLLGYALVQWTRWPKTVADALTQFVFSVAIPAMLFRLMSGVSDLPTPDWTLLIVFFGSCLAVFLLGRVLGRFMFRMDGVSQSVFGLGAVFSNIVLLGLPLSKITLGDASVPAVSLVLVFNAFLLWTLVTVSVEWARRDRSADSNLLAGIAKTAKDVITNPIVASILGGTLFGFTGIPLPAVLDQTLVLLGEAAAPLALVALGMGLATYSLKDGLKESLVICALKLVVQPLLVYLLARWFGLSALNTQVVVLLAAAPTGANVYLMARQFKTLEGTIAFAMVLSVALSSITIPVALALLGVKP
jgi:malonate transporter